jgi:cystathionine beta-lyase
MKFNTKTIHGGQKDIDPAYNSVMAPIYQTTTYRQSSPGHHLGFEYSRGANPTRSALQKSIASIENGKHGIAFGSGLAAIDAVLKTLQPGDEVVATKNIYGGSYRLFENVYKTFGIQFHFVDLQNAKDLEQHLEAKTKLIWIETPTNPMMNIIDVKVVSKLAKQHNILLAVDNTFATPYLQQPLELGADIVMHSGTKYLGGHSDVVLGALVVNDDQLAEQLFFIQNASGAIPGPMDCFLVLRGIKTLHLRMQRHCENAKTIANFLHQHPKVEKVYWPGLLNHPNHSIAKSQMKAYGGMVSFSMKGDSQEEAVQFLERLRVFTLAESLGGVESLAGHPATMTHGNIPKEERLKIGILDSLIRLSVGVEDQDDLIKDLQQALS